MLILKTKNKAMNVNYVIRLCKMQHNEIKFSVVQLMSRVKISAAVPEASNFHKLARSLNSDALKHEGLLLQNDVYPWHEVNNDISL